MMTVMRRKKRARKARRMLIVLQIILQLLPLLVLLLKRKSLNLHRRSWKLNKVSRVTLKTKWQIESFIKHSIWSIFSHHSVMLVGIGFFFPIPTVPCLFLIRIFIGCSTKTGTVICCHWMFWPNAWSYCYLFYSQPWNKALNFWFPVCINTVHKKTCPFLIFFAEQWNASSYFSIM